jgi:purine-binding chemotaxis protein CheW
LACELLSYGYTDQSPLRRVVLYAQGVNLSTPELMRGINVSSSRLFQTLAITDMSINALIKHFKKEKRRGCMSAASISEKIIGGNRVDQECKYLTFQLAKEEYGIGILKIKEIIGMMPITSVPQTPEFIKGVINLRGKVIPVIDLRMRFGMKGAEYDERTCIIVVEIDTGSHNITIGIVVDAVSEVMSIKREDIADTPPMGASLNTEFIMGMAKMDGGVKILLDIDRVFKESEITVLENAA